MHTKVLLGCFVIIIVFFLLFCKKETFDEAQKTLTLGNWGHPQPLSCYEIFPQKNNFYAPLTSIQSCNACNLNCSTQESMSRCKFCLQFLK